MEDQTSFRQFLKVKLNLVNVLIFVFLFSTASFDYYLINFYLKYIPGNVYVNTIVAASSACIANYISGIIINKMGP